MPDYRPMTDYLRGIFHGRVIKIAVNAGLGCPNRDGTVGRDGCIYCNNLTFNPSYAASDATASITRQLEDGVRFNSRKGDCIGYLAYFQSYTPLRRHRCGSEGKNVLKNSITGSECLVKIKISITMLLYL